MSSPAVKLKVAVLGASGRTGTELVRQLRTHPHFLLSGALVSANSAIRGRDAAEGVSYSSSLEEVIQGADLLIDFSTPEISVRAAGCAAQRGVPLLVATTGHSSSQLSDLQGAAADIPLLIAPNTSLGVYVLHELATLAQRLLGDSFDVEMLEIHHRGKKDAPSGTGLSVARHVAESGDLSVVTGRPAERKSRELGLVSLRGGSVPGDHTVFFLGQGERIEISHRAEGRELFARGALVLGEKLVRCPPGSYRVADLFSESPV